MRQIFILSFAFICLFATSAFAQDPSSKEFDVDSHIRSCGTPQHVSISTTPSVGICDIYTRQLAYREERLKLNKQLLQRQKNFSDTGLEAYRRYIAALENLNESRETANK